MINGQLVSSDSAQIGWKDIGLLRAYGIFDFFLFLGGRACFLQDHLDRFLRSAQWLNMDMPWSKSELEEMILTLAKANGVQDASIRLLLTGGYSEDGYMPAGNPNLLILEQPFTHHAEEKFQRGLHLMTHAYQRDLFKIKTTNYLVPIMLRHQIKAIGADDVLYHQNGLVSESSRSNFFIVTREGILVTPDDGILEGITRKYALALAQDHMKVELRPLRLEEVWDASEAFITNSSMGVMGITKIDGRSIGEGVPGAVTQMLRPLLMKVKVGNALPVL
jgi:branched-subunit amino acid aminotransferase/4-amino-4-deoxychorismate lyase